VFCSEDILNKRAIWMIHAARETTDNTDYALFTIFEHNIMR